MNYLFSQFLKKTFLIFYFTISKFNAILLSYFAYHIIFLLHQIKNKTDDTLFNISQMYDFLNATCHATGLKGDLEEKMFDLFSRCFCIDKNNNPRYKINELSNLFEKINSSTEKIPFS